MKDRAQKLECGATRTVRFEQLPEDKWPSDTYVCIRTAGHAGDHVAADSMTRWEDNHSDKEK